MGTPPTDRPVVTPERLGALPDLGARLREVSRFIEYGQSRVRDGRAVRARLVREAHAAGWARKDIARALGLTDEAVKSIIRSLPRE